MLPKTDEGKIWGFTIITFPALISESGGDHMMITSWLGVCRRGLRSESTKPGRSGALGSHLFLCLLAMYCIVQYDTGGPQFGSASLQHATCRIDTALLLHNSKPLSNVRGKGFHSNDRPLRHVPANQATKLSPRQHLSAQTPSSSKRQRHVRLQTDKVAMLVMSLGV